MWISGCDTSFVDLGIPNATSSCPELGLEGCRFSLIHDVLGNTRRNASSSSSYALFYVILPVSAHLFMYMITCPFPGSFPAQRSADKKSARSRSNMSLREESERTCHGMVLQRITRDCWGTGTPDWTPVTCCLLQACRAAEVMHPPTAHQRNVLQLCNVTNTPSDSCFLSAYPFTCPRMMICGLPNLSYGPVPLSCLVMDCTN